MAARGSHIATGRVSSLTALLERVSGGYVAFAIPDLYRICALSSGKTDRDVLGLSAKIDFMKTLATQYAAHVEKAESPINPFQDTLLKETLLPYLATSGSQTSLENGVDPQGQGTTGASASHLSHPTAIYENNKNASSGEPTAEERLKAIWEILAEAQRKVSPADDVNEDAGYEVTSNTVQLIEVHVIALEKQLRQLKPNSVSRLIKALAVVNYSNYQHTSLLSRRGCEVAGELPLHAVCQLYFNLHKLNAHDSLQPLVNRIQANVQDLSAEDVFLVAQSLERQANTSSASAALLPFLAAQGAQRLLEAKSPSYHRALLVALSRYNLRNHPAVPAVLCDVERLSEQLYERDLLPLLQAVGELGVGLGAGAGTGNARHPLARAIACLMKRVEVVGPTLDIRNIDALMDVLSVLSADSTAAMQVLMARLDADAGKLTIPQLEFTLRLLSTYPPARGHVCIVSLAFAGALRAESIEAATLERLLVSLATLQHFTDDFFAVAEVLQKQKGGVRKLESVVVLLEECRPRPQASGFLSSSVVSRLGSLVEAAVLGLAPTLSDDELSRIRKLLQQSNLGDAALQQRLVNRARQLQRGKGNATNSGGDGRTGWGGQHRSSTYAATAAGRPGGLGKKKRKPYDPMADLME